MCDVGKGKDGCRMCGWREIVDDVGDGVRGDRVCFGLGVREGSSGKSRGDGGKGNFRKRRKGKSGFVGFRERNMEEQGKTKWEQVGRAVRD